MTNEEKNMQATTSLVNLHGFLDLNGVPRTGDMIEHRVMNYAANYTSYKSVLYRVYISGPMSGIAEHNFPAFFDAEDRIAAHGFMVENPARNVKHTHLPDAWETWMRLAIAQLVRCGEMVQLPGWENSAGAKFEHEIALRLGIKVSTLEEFLK